MAAYFQPNYSSNDLVRLGAWPKPQHKRVTTQPFNYGYDALDRRITTDFSSSYQGWQQAQHFDGRQERNHFNSQGVLRSLDYVPNMQADLYGQLIRQTTHQLDHSAFGVADQIDRVLSTKLFIERFGMIPPCLPQSRRSIFLPCQINIALSAKLSSQPFG